MRNALAHVPKGQHTMVAAAIRQAFLQPDAEAARQTWRHVADQLRARWPKLAALMDDSEHDVLAYMAFPAQPRTRCSSAARYWCSRSACGRAGMRRRARTPPRNPPDAGSWS